MSEVSDSPSGVADAERPSLVERLAYRAADVVRRGLTDRARLVHVQVLSETQFAIGVLLNGSQATRVLDLGPAADREAECAAFRALWRDRAELRRFKDGSIAESVVWNVSRPEEGALIPGRAVRHLVSLHLGSDVVISAPSSEEAWLTILQTPASAREAVNVAGSEKLGFRPMMESYEGLYKLLKSVDDDMPLAILHVAPASELLRYASVFVPHPVDVARAAGAPACISYMPVAEVTLQFESSQRWPDDLAAVQKLKLALLEKLARVLAARERGLQAGIALDAGASDIDDAAALEVVMASGSAFRIRIHHDRERTLLERALEPPLPGIPRNLPPPPRRLVTPALALHQRRFNWAPAHHAALAPLHHRFPSFSTAARLLKRWAAAHLLSPHVGPEALELLTAHTYLDSGALAPPASATAGFLRTLAFLAEWDWRATPAFIPLAAVTRDAASASGRPRFPSEERQASLAAFARRPESDAWALATEADTAGTRWTGGVGRLVAGRVAALAAASLRLVRASTTDVHALDIPALFTTPTEHYDALLHLVPGTRAAQAVRLDPTVWESRLAFRNLQTDTTVRIAFDPVARFVADIQAAYGDTLLVFHDALGGDTLAILWNPAKQPRAFKPLVGFNARPAHTQAALVEVNRDAVLAEIARMGQGIVQRIETR